MIVPGSANALLLRSARGYQINQSLRFRASNSAFLSRTLGTPTSSTRFTLSLWFKRGQFGGIQSFLAAGTSVAAPYAVFQFNTSFPDQLDLFQGTPGTLARLVTTAVFRDPTAWYHLVYVWDSDNATATSRQRLWINGVEITSFSSRTDPTLGAASVLNAARAHEIGRQAATASQHWDGYMTEYYLIDGQVLSPSSFGAITPATGKWDPIRYTGTYGTNGFYLPFNDAASTTTISQDRSGNGNNWTSSGISVTAGRTFDQMTDTPTNNFPTINPLDITNIGTRTIDAAGLELGTVATGVGGGRATQALPTTGKWYWEVTFASTGPTGNKGVGLGTANGNISGGAVPTECITYNANGNTTSGGSYVASGYTTYGVTETIGVAYDADAGTVRFYRNNTAQGGSALPTTSMTAPLFPLSVNPSGVSCIDVYNFGQRPFAYTPPTGFVALNTANLPTPTIQRGDDAMQATLRTGTGASASVTSLRFQPDLVWIKSRSNATNNNLFDAVRGVNNGLVSNSNAGQYTDVNSLTAFNSNGYTLGTDGSSRGVNINTNTYVDWAWREGAAYGFDIVTYTGTGSARTVAHGLNAVPHMMILKRTEATLSSWYVYHRNANVSPATGALFLDLNSAFSAGSMWNSTLPTSSVFSLGGAGVGVNDNTIGYVNYLFTSIPGFSLFGSYTGNGSADGPFVWCGFRPRFVMVKRVDSTENWYIYDTARNTFNAVDLGLLPNLTTTETGYAPIDVTAAGFKIRGSGASWNASGGTYIFDAFAENPFKFANAR